MMMSVEDFEYYNNYTYEKQKARDEKAAERERRKRFLIKNCESDSRYARELHREFGIQLH